MIAKGGLNHNFIDYKSQMIIMSRIFTIRKGGFENIEKYADKFEKDGSQKFRPRERIK